MPHTPFTIDRETSERLRAVNGTMLEKMVVRDAPWTDEEIAAIARRPRDPSERTYTTAEMLKLVEGE